MVQWRKWLPWAVAGVGCILLRKVLLALLMQLLAGYLLMALALPLCRLMERRLAPGLAAALSFGVLTVVLVGALLGVIPPLIQQFGQLGEEIPTLLKQGQGLLIKGQTFLNDHGFDLTPVREELFVQLGQQAGAAVGRAAQGVKQASQAAGKLVLSPLLAFYLLRDRRQIASLAVLAIPVQYRIRAVRAGREMRRETVNFLRGQLVLSAAVGALTALGLLAAGTPAWLALGLLMGVMELIPYIGPVMAGIPAVLLAMQGGLGKALWTLAALLIVQQVDSSLLSPRLLAGATNLHPLFVLLLVSAGGMVGGAVGMLAALPLAVSIRGGLRGWRE